MPNRQDVGARFACSLRALQGCGYGLRQKTMTGTIGLDQSLASRLEAMLSAAQALSTNQFYKPELSSPAQSPAVLRVVHLYFLLQQYAKIPVFEEYRLNAETPSRGDRRRPEGNAFNSYRIILPYWHLQASRIVIAWIASTAKQSEGIPDIRDLLERISPVGACGTNAYPFLRAGWRQRIHYTQVSGRIMQFGLGMQSRWMDSTFTDRTSAISASITKNKHATNQLLSQLGFPMPKQIIVTEQQQAKQASIELGMPVVIKPLCQDQGRGVSVGLDDEHEVGEAFELAAAYGPEVIIEEFCKGLDYRLTVFQGAVVKIMQRTPLSVVGDGRSSIADLLRQKEEMALKERCPSTSAESPYAVDSEILQTIRRQGYALDDVPLEHKLVAMRRKANLSAGGSQTLVPISSVHPDNIRLAVYLATLLRLDCCGIDLIIPDICQSWLQVGCHVIELNAQPQVGVAHAPEVYGEILQQMLSDRAPSVQLILDLSSSGPLSCISTEDPLVQRLSAAGPSPVVLATSTNLWKDLQLIQSTPHDQGSAIQSALLDPTARSIILIMSLTEFLSRGLPTHRIDKILCLTRQVLPPVASQRLKSIRAMAPDIPLTVVSDSSHPN